MLGTLQQGWEDSVGLIPAPTVPLPLAGGRSRGGAEQGRGLGSPSSKAQQWQPGFGLRPAAKSPPLQGLRGEGRGIGAGQENACAYPPSPVYVTNSPRSFIFTLFLNTEPFTSREPSQQKVVCC